MSESSASGEGVAIERPRDLAVLLLAAGELSPRQRARDQQADLAGNAIKRQLLARLIELDPDPDQLPQTLDEIIRGIPGPPGPGRAIAAAVLEDFRVAVATPSLVVWLLDRSAAASSGRPGGRCHGDGSPTS